MRVIAGLPGDQARAVEAFLRASNNPPARVVRTRAPSGLSGKELIQRFGCRGCHRISGQGGTIGPSLAGIFDRRKGRVITQTVRALADVTRAKGDQLFQHVLERAA